MSSLSGSEPESSSDESDSSGYSSATVEITRSPPTSRHHGGHSAEVFFAEPEFEDQGHNKPLPFDGYGEYDEYDDPSLCRRRKGKRSRNKYKSAPSSRRTHRAFENSGSESSDPSDMDSDSQSVISRRESRRSLRRSTLASSSRKNVDSKRLRDIVGSSEDEDDSDVDFLSFKCRRLLARELKRSR